MMVVVSATSNVLLVCRQRLAVNPNLTTGPGPDLRGAYTVSYKPSGRKRSFVLHQRYENWDAPYQNENSGIEH